MLAHPDIVEPDEDDIAELRAETRHQRRYSRQLSAHPECIDPDHPGCEQCQEDDEG